MTYQEPIKSHKPPKKPQGPGIGGPPRPRGGPHPGPDPGPGPGPVPGPPGLIISLRLD